MMKLISDARRRRIIEIMQGLGTCIGFMSAAMGLLTVMSLLQVLSTPGYQLDLFIIVYGVLTTGIGAVYVSWSPHFRTYPLVWFRLPIAIPLWPMFLAWSTVALFALCVGIDSPLSSN